MSEHCRSCGAAIRWVTLHSGKRMPLDTPATPGHGNVLVCDTHELADAYCTTLGRALVLSDDAARGRTQAGIQLWLSHFATCPAADAHRQTEGDAMSELLLPGAVTETALTLPDALSFEQWAAIGETLGRIGRAHQWWIGDWLNYGERSYGETYTQAIDATGYEYGYLMNVVWVARSLENSRRRENLSFAHHQEVAALEPAAQDEWLDRAQRHGWTVRDLRTELRRPPELPAPPPPEFRRWFAGELLRGQPGALPGDHRRNREGQLTLDPEYARS